jgi:hypothetical protein
MFHRQQRTQAELEKLCLIALQGRLGLNHVDYVRIGPYTGPKGWTWQLLEAGPDGLQLCGNEATDVVRTFQENFDLKGHQAALGNHRLRPDHRA